jgi:hypothetical protein
MAPAIKHRKYQSNYLNMLPSSRGLIAHRDGGLRPLHEVTIIMSLSFFLEKRCVVLACAVVGNNLLLDLPG